MDEACDEVVEVLCDRVVHDGCVLRSTPEADQPSFGKMEIRDIASQLGKRSSPFLFQRHRIEDAFR